MFLCFCVCVAAPSSTPVQCAVAALVTAADVSVFSDGFATAAAAAVHVHGAATAAPDLSLSCLQAWSTMQSDATLRAQEEVYIEMNQPCFNASHFHLGRTVCDAGLAPFTAACAGAGGRMCKEVLVLERDNVKLNMTYGQCFPSTQHCTEADLQAELSDFDQRYCQGPFPYDVCELTACGLSSTTSRAKPSSGLSGGQKAGIAIGVLLVVGAAVGGFAFWKHRRASKPSLGVYAPNRRPLNEDNAASLYDEL